MPGQPINLSSTVYNADLFATVTLEGTTYRVGGQISSSLEPDLRLTFTAPTLLFAPPLNVAPTVALTTPVSFDGIFAHLGVVEQLGATATATIVLERANCGPFGGCWESDSATYDLQATPEATTLVLLGTSLAGIGGWVWRRRLG